MRCRQLPGSLRPESSTAQTSRAEHRRRRHRCLTTWPERTELIRRIAASPSAGEVLPAATRHDEPLSVDLLAKLLDRVPDDDLPGLAAAIAEHLPGV